MAHEVSVHEAQTSILRELLFKPDAGYTDLRKKTNLESDHFKFHIRRLLETGYITKTGSGRYCLTPKGKEYANKIDTDHGVIERQPKSAVIIVLQNGRGEVLVQERQKHPYFGFWGYPSGKIRWGETIMQTGARELMEESGLTADLTHKGVYHEHVVTAEDGDLLEDKIFHVIGGRKPSGVMKDAFEGGRNVWMDPELFSSIHKRYASCDIETQVANGGMPFVERTQIYRHDEF